MCIEQKSSRHYTSPASQASISFCARPIAIDYDFFVAEYAEGALARRLLTLSYNLGHRDATPGDGHTHPLQLA